MGEEERERGKGRKTEMCKGGTEGKETPFPELGFGAKPTTP
jgi:hypothetical protein